MSPLHINRISLELFNTTLKRYPETASSTLAELDTLRYETIPAKLDKGKKDAYLLKADVEKLVEWKLKHGTFRPSLMNLVKSNSADVVKSTTQAGFASLKDDKDAMKSLKILIALRGIGPATASLLLSVYQPDEVPFFSDELFRWTHWDAPGKKEYNWDRSIKYNVTEYKELLASVEALRKRLGVRAVDAEKVAYVLGKERVELDMVIEMEGDAETLVQDKVREDSEVGRRVEDQQEESRKRVQEALKEIREKKASEEGRKGVEDVEAKSKKCGSRHMEAISKAKEVTARGEERQKLGQKLKELEAEEAEEQAGEGAEKQGAKRKAKEEKTPAEGMRRRTRRKV